MMVVEEGLEREKILACERKVDALTHLRTKMMFPCRGSIQNTNVMYFDKSWLPFVFLFKIRNNVSTKMSEKPLGKNEKFSQPPSDVNVNSVMTAYRELSNLTVDS